MANDWTCFDNFTLLYHGQDLDKVRQSALQKISDYESLNERNDDVFSSSLEELRETITAASDEAVIQKALDEAAEAYSIYRSAEEVETTAIVLTDLLENADFMEGLVGWNAQVENAGTSTLNWGVRNSSAPADVEAYAGYSELELSGYSLTQEVTLSPGMYSLEGYAFYRYGTSYNSDINNEGELHSYAYLFAGDNAVKVKRLGDIVADSYANTMDEASAEFAKGNYLNRLTFTLTETTTLTLGFKGEHTRYRSWFIAGPVTLRKINEQILKEELQEDFGYVKDQYSQRWDSYTAISRQALDHAAFDQVLLAAHESLKEIETLEELDAKDAEVGHAIREFIKTGTTATGQFDITPLIVNASFDRNTDGWTSTQAIGWNSNGVAEFFGYESARMEQELKDMPAGEYTLKVQTFYRPTTYGTSSRGYEAGTIDNRGVLFFGDRSQSVKDINDDARYLSANPFGDVAGAFNKVIPDNLAGVDAAFSNGQYWNVMRTMLSADGDVTIGLSYDNALGFCWMPFDNFRLYYGSPVQDITLSETGLFDIHEDTYANVTMDKVLKAGQYNSLCLPFDVPATEFESVWTLADVSFDEESQALTGTLIPSQEMKAGIPYFVRVTTDKPLHFDNVLVRAFPPDSVPVIWEGAALQGAYGRTFLRRTYSMDETGQLIYMPSKLNAPGYFVQVNLSADIFRKADVITLKEIDFQDVDFTLNMENIQTREFLANAKYSSSSAASIVEDYRRCPPGRRDQPHTVILPVPPAAANASLAVRYATSEDFSDAVTQNLKAGVALYELRNLMPQTDYYFELIAGSDVVSRGHFFTEGHLRMIKVNSVSNVRDLGGWLTADGQRVRYGLIYRGGEMNAGHVMTEDDRQELLRLGIGAEVDLREDIDIDGADITGSVFGADAPYIYINQNRWNEDALELDVEKYKNVFNLILENIRKGNAVYFHCIWGADRTGALAFLLEGLMGLTTDQMYKDYELTSFSIAGIRKKEGLDAKFTYLNGKYTGKQQDRFLAYWRDEVGIPEADLKEFIRIMVGDDVADGIEQTPIGRQDSMEVRADGRIYDLTGRGMSHQGNHLPQGIYIKDGKKFVVK